MNTVQEQIEWLRKMIRRWHESDAAEVQVNKLIAVKDTMQAMLKRQELLEKVVAAAEPINDLGMDAAGYEWDELDRTLAALEAA